MEPTDFKRRLAAWKKTEKEFLALVPTRRKRSQDPVFGVQKTDTELFCSLFQYLRDTPNFSVQQIIDDSKIPLGFLGHEKFVDMGSGTGLVVAAMADVFKVDAVGVEIQEHLVDTASQNLEKCPSDTQKRVELINGDLRNLAGMSEVCKQATVLYWTNFYYSQKGAAIERGWEITKTLADALVAARNHSQPLWLITTNPLNEHLANKSDAHGTTIPTGKLGANSRVRFHFRWVARAKYDRVETDSQQPLFYIYTLEVRDNDILRTYLRSRRNELETILFDPTYEPVAKRIESGAAIRNPILFRAICHFCLTSMNDPEEVVHCSSCGVAYYCSQHCLDKDRVSAHAHECISLKNWSLIKRRFLPRGKEDGRNRRSWDIRMQVALRFLALVAFESTHDNNNKSGMVDTLANLIYNASTRMCDSKDARAAKMLFLVVRPDVLYTALKRNFAIRERNLHELLTLLICGIRYCINPAAKYFAVTEMASSWYYVTIHPTIRRHEAPKFTVEYFADILSKERRQQFVESFHPPSPVSASDDDEIHISEDN